VEPWRRAAALRALADIPNETPERVNEIASIGRRDRERGVREVAAIALADLADRSPGDVAATAASAAVANLADETDPAIRAALLGAIRDTRDAAVANTLIGALCGETDSMARDAAAEALGDVAVAHRARTIDALAARFVAEPDEDVRRTILASIVRAGRANSATTLEALRPNAGSLALDVDDYLVALRSGEDDPEKLAALKAAREAARELARAPRAGD
jgi:hypothetical protein